MRSTITDDDVGKPVEGADGEALGTVVDVEAATAHVEPEPGMTDSIRAVLDWDRDPGETVPLETDAVGEITDDAIRLRAAVSAESVAPADGAETEPRVGGDSAAGPESNEGTESTDGGADRVDPADVTDPESDGRAREDVGDRADVRGGGSKPEESTADDAAPTDVDDRDREQNG